MVDKQYSKTKTSQPITGGWSKNLTTIQSYLRENKSGFLVGDSITVVDFNALNIVAFWYKCWDSDRFLKEFPVLEEYIQRLGRDPKIAEYNINKRCKTSWVSYVPLGRYCDDDE